MNLKTSIISLTLLAYASSKAIKKDQDENLDPHRLPDKHSKYKRQVEYLNPYELPNDCIFLYRENKYPSLYQRILCLKTHNMFLELLLGRPEDLNIPMIRLLDEYAEGIRSGKITTSTITTTTTPKPTFPSRYPVIREG